MELNCGDCGAVLQIPAERVPQSSTFRVTCPRCKGKINASTKKSEHDIKEEEKSSSDNGLAPGGVELTEPSDEFAPQDAGSSLPGRLSALICVAESDRRTRYQVIVESLGFLTDAPISPTQALERLRYNQYGLVVLDDTFGETVPNPVATYLAGLNMNIRRDMVVVLSGERWKTGDSLEAFFESVDLVFHPADVGHLATLLTRAASDHQRFYKVFNECLIEAGKKLP
jgi:phage FluMu protein Com